VAKGKYERWLTEEGLTLIRGWARDGLSNEQIAKNMGIAAKTLYVWIPKHSKICEALKKGKEVADYEVENALFASAMSGNTTAQIFWLKNRCPDKWRDRSEVKSDINSIIEEHAVHLYLPDNGRGVKPNGEK